MSRALLLSAAPPYSQVDPYHDMVRRLQQMGFSGTMMGSSGDWSDEDIREIRSIFENGGIRIDEVGAYCNLLHPDPTVRRKNIADVRTAVSVAEKLGCRNVATVLGSPANPMGFALAPETFSTETWELARRTLEEIASFTEGTSVRFLIEPCLFTCMNSPAALHRMIGEVNHPNIGVLLDVVNLVTVDCYWRTGDLINECFDLLGDWIHVCHAKDISCDPNDAIVYLRETYPGQGALDYKTLIRRIVALDRPVPLMVEHIAEDARLRDARAYICAQADEVGVRVS